MLIIQTPLPSEVPKAVVQRLTSLRISIDGMLALKRGVTLATRRQTLGRRGMRLVAAHREGARSTRSPRSSRGRRSLRSVPALVAQRGRDARRAFGRRPRRQRAVDWPETRQSWSQSREAMPTQPFHQR